MRSHILRSAALGAALVVTTGCPTRDVSNLAPHDELEQVKEIPIDLKRDIDILFVIDNSGSMSEEQTSLATNFPRFINVLETIEGGLPNVHIGVVSSNVGISPFQTTGCVGNGDDGKLQNAPRGACTPPNGYFISDILDPSGAIDPTTGQPARITNYPSTATLADVFSCIARLGSTGCGLEQHLESMKRALDGHRPENANFIRSGMGSDPDAFLAVIFVADEDDCSAKDGSVFDPSQNDISDPLGPFGSFRCTEFGIFCDGSPISRSPANYNECEPMPVEMADYIKHPDEYVDFLKGLKSDERNVIVAGIIGNPTPVNIVLDEDGNPELDCSCGCGTAQTAVPAVRLGYFINSFPDRSTFTSICNEDLSDALNVIAELLKRVVGNPCLDGAIDTRDLDGNPANGVQLDCQVSDVVAKGTDQEQSFVIPRCEMTGPTMPVTTTIPCWWVEEDPMTCSSTATSLILHVERGGTEPDDTTVVARCVACEDPLNCGN
jgi:hypothetical protein